MIFQGESKAGDSTAYDDDCDDDDDDVECAAAYCRAAHVCMYVHVQLNQLCPANTLLFISPSIFGVRTNP